MGEIEIQVEFSGNRFVLRELLPLSAVRVCASSAKGRSCSRMACAT